MTSRALREARLAGLVPGVKIGTPTELVLQQIETYLLTLQSTVRTLAVALEAEVNGQHVGNADDLVRQAKMLLP